MDYDIRTIPHNAQRYDTVGDYYQKRDNLLVVRISDFKEVYFKADDYEFLILIHELIEEYLTRKAGVSLEAVDKFDLQFEVERQRGEHAPDAEPGMDSRCPYIQMHTTATFVEKLLALILNVDWENYNRIVNSFKQEPQGQAIEHEILNQADGIQAVEDRRE